jgi:hypothetical protein
MFFTVLSSFCPILQCKTIMECSSINSLCPDLTHDCLFVSDFNDTLFEYVDNSSHDIKKIKPVEKETIPFLRSLIKKAIKTIILTSRYSYEKTECELHDIQDATTKIFSFSPFHLSKTEHMEIKLSTGVVNYKNGILYCGNNDKGSALTALLKILNLNPRKIIFLDDKKHHIRSVAHAAKILTSEFLGFHYNH